MTTKHEFLGHRRVKRHDKPGRPKGSPNKYAGDIPWYESLSTHIPLGNGASMKRRVGGE